MRSENAKPSYMTYGLARFFSYVKSAGDQDFFGHIFTSPKPKLFWELHVKLWTRLAQ
jgi:hypothetical protein